MQQKWSFGLSSIQQHFQITNSLKILSEKSVPTDVDTVAGTFSEYLKTIEIFDEKIGDV